MDNAIVELNKEVSKLKELLADVSRAELSLIELLIEKEIITREEFIEKSKSLPDTL